MGWRGSAFSSGCVFWGDMEEGKVQLPQTHLSPNWLEGIWQLGAMDRATPLHPPALPSPLCVGFHIICISVCDRLEGFNQVLWCEGHVCVAEYD